MVAWCFGAYFIKTAVIFICTCPIVKKIKEKLFGQSQEDTNNTEGQGSAAEERERLRNGPWDLWTDGDKYLEMKHITF